MAVACQTLCQGPDRHDPIYFSQPSVHLIDRKPGLMGVFDPSPGNGNPLQYSCLENPRDGGVWWAAICGVAQSQTQLTRLSSSSSSLAGVWMSQRRSL